MMRRKLELTCILIALAATAGCGKSQETGYVPGLGELMAGQQVRHAKLWFAGENENWRLAAYEVDVSYTNEMPFAPKELRHVAWGWRFCQPQVDGSQKPFKPQRGDGSLLQPMSCRRPFGA